MWRLYGKSHVRVIRSIGLEFYPEREVNGLDEQAGIPLRRIIMSKNTWVKWSLLVAGSTVAALQLGSCIAQFLLQTFIQNAVN